MVVVFCWCWWFVSHNNQLIIIIQKKLHSIFYRGTNIHFQLKYMISRLLETRFFFVRGERLTSRGWGTTDYGRTEMLEGRSNKRMENWEQGRFLQRKTFIFVSSYIIWLPCCWPLLYISVKSNKIATKVFQSLDHWKRYPSKPFTHVNKFLSAIYKLSDILFGTEAIPSMPGLYYFGGKRFLCYGACRRSHRVAVRG